MGISRYQIKKQVKAELYRNIYKATKQLKKQRIFTKVVEAVTNWYMLRIRLAGRPILSDIKLIRFRRLQIIIACNIDWGLSEENHQYWYNVYLKCHDKISN